MVFGCLTIDLFELSLVNFSEFIAPLSNYFRHVCLVKLLVFRDGFIKYWVDGNMLTMDAATKIFKILRQPECKYLTQVCCFNYSSVQMVGTKLHFGLYLNDHAF